MEHCTFTYSANTGGVLSLGPFRIWYDALHDKRVAGFSTLSPALLAEIMRSPAFFDPDVIFFSHCHADHFSQPLAETARERWPRARLFLPENRFPGQLPLQGSAELSVADTILRFCPLPHEGARHAHVPHFGCLVQRQGWRVLLTGDCAVGSPALAELTGGEPVDLALLDFPWLTLRRGRAAILELIQPRHLLIGHLPFQADDRWGYRLAARKASERLPDVPDIRLLLEPLQTETFS